jgi:hypothetical protein
MGRREKRTRTTL